MANISYNNLQYSSRNYTFAITVFTPTDKTSFDSNNATLSIPLDNISNLVINSSLTSPLLTGSISFSVIGNNPFQDILSNLYAYLNIFIAEHDGNLAKYDKQGFTKYFEHQFLITKVNITEITVNSISYSLDFISKDIWKVENKIYVTTRAKELPIVNILNTAFKVAGLNLNLNNVDSNTVNRSIVYTSSINDSLNTIVPYLQKQLLTPINAVNSTANDMSLVSYVYNHMKDTYQLWNLNSFLTYLNNVNKSNLDYINICLGSNPMFSQFDQHAEILQCPSTNKFNTIQALSQYNSYNFDFTTNTFNNIVLDNKTKTYLVDGNWQDKSATGIKFIKKYNEFNSNVYPGDKNIALDTYHSPSDSQTSLYSKLLNITLGDDTVLVKTVCDISRFPGNPVILSILDSTTTDKTDLNSRLYSLYGPYLIVGNSMIYEYNATTKTPMFRNYLHLNRPINIKKYKN